MIECNIEKQFKNAQEIHKFFSKQKFDSGEWHFLIFETQNPSHNICENWTKTGIPNKYFGNTETNKNRMIDNKQVARWKIIEKEMADKNIESVTVKIFKLKKQIMPRINEHVFKLNNEEYLLSYYDKPKVTKNGVEQKVLPILKEYITRENLPVQIVNKSGNNEVPYTLARKVLDYFLGNFFKAKQTLTIKNKITNKHLSSKNADQKIHDVVTDLDWKKIQDENTRKLLIIGCSDSKNLGGEQYNSANYFSNNEIYNSLLRDREKRVKEYSRLIDVEPNYFLYKDKQKFIKRNKKPIPKDYFKDCLLQALTMPAIQRYNGKFYSDELKELYSEKNQNSNLHILIISGLYGVIEFRDSIIDYHLKITKNPFWTLQNNTIIQNTICNYIKTNKIDNEMVFYSLSQNYVNALKPIEKWNNLWYNHGGRGDHQANDLKNFLNKI